MLTLKSCLGAAIAAGLIASVCSDRALAQVAALRSFRRAAAAGESNIASIRLDHADDRTESFSLKSQTEQTAEAKIVQALEGPASYDLAGTPLRDFVERLKVDYKIPIKLDAQAIT